MGWDGNVAGMGRGVMRTGFGGGNWRQEATLKTKRRFEYNNRRDVKDVGWVRVEWSDQA